MKKLNENTTYARTTMIFELEEHERNLTVEELEEKFYMPFGGRIQKYGHNLIEVIRYDD